MRVLAITPKPSFRFIETVAVFLPLFVFVGKASKVTGSGRIVNN